MIKRIENQIVSTHENLLLRARLRKTAAGRAILSSLHLSGTENMILGKGIFKKIGKGIKKVGKVTSKFTGRMAKVAAGLVGIPPGAIDALAKIDPTAHKAVIKSLQNSAAGQKAQEITSTPGAQGKNIFSNIKPIYLAAGAAGIIGIILFTSKKK